MQGSPLPGLIPNFLAVQRCTHVTKYGDSSLCVCYVRKLVVCVTTLPPQELSLPKPLTFSQRVQLGEVPPLPTCHNELETENEIT